MWRLGSVIVGVLAALSSRPYTPQAPTPQAPAIVGTWRLKSIVDTLPDGSPYSWLGARPTGEIRYDAAGHMAVQFMRDPRPTVAAGTARQATPQELRAVYDGYYAYFGRYKVSARGDSVTHFIQASLHPEEVGVVYRRAVRVEGDRLLITSQFIDESDRVVHRRFLTFARVR
jgi:Lipocalin-like domain